MKKLLIVPLLSIVLIACSQNAGKKDGVVASAPAPVEHSETDGHDHGSQQPAAKTSSMRPADPDKVIPAVAEKYSGILIGVANKTDKTQKEVAVPFSQRTAIEGTPLSIEVFSLFPDFTMVDGGYANKSMEESNPGAKVKIYKDGQEIFNGWLFQNFPGMHGLNDEQYDIVMINSVLK